MRNMLEIHNLGKLSTCMLQKQQTILIHREGSIMKSIVKIDVLVPRNEPLFEI